MWTMSPSESFAKKLLRTFRRPRWLRWNGVHGVRRQRAEGMKTVKEQTETPRIQPHFQLEQGGGRAPVGPRSADEVRGFWTESDPPSTLHPCVNRQNELLP